jgi:hypothetical protein
MKVAAKSTNSNRQYRTYLSQDVTKAPADKRCHGLGGKGVRIEGLIVCGPAGNSSSANLSGIAEEGASDGATILAESRLDSTNTLLYRAVGGDTEGARGKEGDEKETEELHCGCSRKMYNSSLNNTKVRGEMTRHRRRQGVPTKYFKT